MKRQYKGNIGWLALLALLCVAGAAAAEKGGKGGDKGSNDGSDGTVNPPTAPVGYVLDAVFVEGFGFSSIFDTNDHGELLYTATLSEATSTTVASDATHSAAIVNIHTGQIQYLDQLLAKPTPWTVKAEGVDSVQFLTTMINSQGDCIGNVYETVNGVTEVSEAFLLKRQVDESGKIAYEPISLGPGTQALMLNDLGQIVGGEHASGETRVFFRFADGSKLYFDELGLEGNLSDFNGLNNQGQFLGGTTTDSATGATHHRFVLDLSTLQVTPIDGFAGLGDYWRTNLNDFGAIAGLAQVIYEEKRRGQIRTFSYNAAAFLDPDSGFQVYDNRMSQEGAMLNHQRLRGESAMLFTRTNDNGRELWLKLPGYDPFFVYDSLSSEDLALWSTFTRRGNCELLTPRLPDGSVDHEAIPTIVGAIEIYDPDNTGIGGYAGGFYVLRPAP